jgi:hypothetical protein
MIRLNPFFSDQSIMSHVLGVSSCCCRSVSDVAEWNIKLPVSPALTTVHRNLPVKPSVIIRWYIQQAKNFEAWTLVVNFQRPAFSVRITIRQISIISQVLVFLSILRHDEWIRSVQRQRTTQIRAVVIMNKHLDAFLSKVPDSRVSEAIKMNARRKRY